MLKTTLLTSVCAFALSLGVARADEYTDTAAATAKAATAHADKWDGPTSGPKLAAGKTIVFVAGDLKNGGILGASEGVKEAAAAAGWKVTVIDGQGTVSARTAAMNQALTLRPDGIVVGGFDTKEQQVAFDAAAKGGAIVVGWHAGTRPGPEPEAGIYANVTTSP
jgi:ribose transport system substrate-binding protein